MSDCNDLLARCTLCPRSCGADRRSREGFCHIGDKIRLSRAAPHHWEEPCISGSGGSGTIFFAGCSLGCAFCQNIAIRDGQVGMDVTKERFREICFALKAQGVHNISLVTADHQLPLFLSVLKEIKQELGLPIVCNTGSYLTEKQLEMYDQVVDVYLPDLKFFDRAVSMEFASAPDYFERASKAIRHMADFTGKPVFDEYGILQKGTVVRHLVIPGKRSDSLKIMEYLGENFAKDEILISLMSQFTPNHQPGTPDRRLTSFEYQSVAEKAMSLGFDGYFQEKSSAKEEYTPPFDLEGVC